jgi:thiosulfate dehydrogenase [quinone] large subunit
MQKSGSPKSPLSSSYGGAPLTALVVLRMLIGWHFLYEGLVKFLNPYWTSALFLSESQGPFSGFFTWLVTDTSRLAGVDFLVKWGLVLIGLGLIAGVLTRIATCAGILLLLMFYLCNPPLPGLSYSVPMEGAYLIVNRTLIEAAALAVLWYFPTGQIIGLDRLIFRGRRTTDEDDS